MSGLVTSVSTRTSGAARRPLRSTAAMSRRPRAPGATGAPDASRKRAPRAVSIPVPPSVDALEPMPTTTRETPWSRAAAMAWPKPVVSASHGRSSSRSSMPDVEARSTTAVPAGASAVGGSSSHDVSTARPAGPSTVIGIRRAPGTAAANAATVPSPPSAIGRCTNTADGSTSPHPSASARAASAAVIVPLKLSGARTTVVIGPALECCLAPRPRAAAAAAPSRHPPWRGRPDTRPR